MPNNLAHNEEEHGEVQRSEGRLTRRVAKKRRRVRVSGKSVFLLGKLLRRGARTRRRTKHHRVR